MEPTRTPSLTNARLEGLDLARYAAFVGMVVVNFRIAMGAESDTSAWHGTGAGGDGTPWHAVIANLLEGRAAALFVVLAGIGLGLAVARGQTRTTTLRRAAFLLVAGLADATVFSGDILHFYAFYFAISALCLRLGPRTLGAMALATVLLFVGLAAILDYDRGWDWSTYEYEDFWSPAGFVRHVFFNGWHPVVPWIGFFWVGMALARTDLSDGRTQRRLVVWGALVAGAAELSSRVLLARIEMDDAELEQALFGTSPIPPMPLYMLAAGGTAVALVGLALLVEPRLKRAGVLGLVTPAGRQTLTLYFAHIFLGMGSLQVLGLLGGQTMPAAWAASLGFCLVATVFAYRWSRRFRRGPLEGLMRRVTG